MYNLCTIGPLIICFVPEDLKCSHKRSTTSPFHDTLKQRITGEMLTWLHSQVQMLEQVDNSSTGGLSLDQHHSRLRGLTIALCGYSLDQHHTGLSMLTIALCGYSLDQHHTGLRGLTIALCGDSLDHITLG